MTGTWMPWSPSRRHRPSSRAPSMTGIMLHQVTPTTDPTSQATLIPRTTAAMRWALAHRDRTIVSSTTSRAAMGA